MINATILLSAVLIGWLASTFSPWHWLVKQIAIQTAGTNIRHLTAKHPAIQTAIQTAGQTAVCQKCIGFHFVWIITLTQASVKSGYLDLTSLLDLTVLNTCITAALIGYLWENVVRRLITCIPERL